MMSGVPRILLLVVVTYAAWCVIVFLAQRWLQYPGVSLVPPARPPDIPGLETLEIPTSFGRVEAWYLPASPPPSGPGPALVHFHGNNELIDDWARLVGGLNRRGVAVLLVEFPGYRRSDGKPSQGSITETALAAYDLLASRSEVDGDRIISYGRSLGGGAACQLARHRPVAALALTSTFTSVRHFSRHYLVPGFLTRDPFDNRAVVSSFAGPVLITHGRQDVTIPFSHGVALADASPRARLVAHEATHNDCPPDFEAHWDDVVGLLGAP